MTTRSATASSLIAAAQRKGRGKGGGKGRARAQAASAAKLSSTVIADPGLSWDDEPQRVQGLITLGVARGMAGVRRAASWGLHTWLVIMAAVAVIAVALTAWRAAPAPEPLVTARFENAADIPTPLTRSWVLGFPGYRELATSPTHAVLSDFAAHLAAQPAVAEVRSVRVEWDARGEQPQRVVAIDLALREPRLPVMLDNGERAWVDDQGVVLPGLLPGPKGEPVVRGYHREDLAAMREVLALWPELRRRLPTGLVSEIHLDHPLGSGDQRGIVMRTTPGVLLVWGAPGEDRYGVDRATKIRNLVHVLECQGDLSDLAAINVRFPEPFAVDPRLR